MDLTNLTHEQAKRLAAALLADEGPDQGAVGSGVRIPRRNLARRLAKWTLTTACVLISLAWISSYWLCPYAIAANQRAEAVIIVAVGSMSVTYEA